MLSDKLLWKWNRLRRMTASEVLYRIHAGARQFAEARGYCIAARVPQPDLSALPTSWLGRGAIVDAGPYLDEAEKIVSGRLNVFALQGTVLGHPPDWNREPRTGKIAPLTYGKALDYRDESQVGDIKYLWEPNRHLHLVTLAQAYALTGESRYTDAVRAQIESWLQQCPYPLGANWASALEVAIRLINWSIVWQLLDVPRSPQFDNPEGRVFWQRWLASVYQHSHFICTHLSRHSSANNHLIGETAGLFVAATTWPCWPVSEQWRRLSGEILEAQLLLQNSPDGVNREQTVWYQQFVLDFAVIAGLAGRYSGMDFSAAYWQRIEAMMEFLASIMDVNGNVPMIGDADDGFVVRLGPESARNPYRSLLATGAVLFGRPEFKSKAVALDDKSRWLLGDDVERRFDELPPAGPTLLPIRTAFPEGGYYILGDAFETSREIRLIVDAGPLGYLSIAAHGHADALSITLAVAGLEILVDPGTHSYHTGRQWRDYFRGTGAHNTIRVDDCDQSVIGGNFLWLQHAAARCESWSSNGEVDEFVGSHDGYMRLPDPVRHRRSIALSKRESAIQLEDTLECEARHTVECCWHFAEACRVAVNGGRIRAERNGIWVELVSKHEGIEAVVREGASEPIGGWVSNRFDVKSPCVTAIWRVPIHGTTRLVTEIRWGWSDRPTDAGGAKALET